MKLGGLKTTVYFTVPWFLALLAMPREAPLRFVLPFNLGL
jgi:hypothetical protein